MKTKTYRGLRVPACSDPFRRGFVKRLREARQGKVVARGDGEVTHAVGRESIEDAARRYGVLPGIIELGLKEELFWALNPHTGKEEVCGVLGELLRNRDASERKRLSPEWREEVLYDEPGGGRISRWVRVEKGPSVWVKVWKVMEMLAFLVMLPFTISGMKDGVQWFMGTGKYGGGGGREEW